MDEFHLSRFLDGQSFVYEWALEEIKAGKKEEHWIWCVFPQMRGIGSSSLEIYYGIASLDEARAYVENEVLNSRLREITQALLCHEGKTIEDIMDKADSLKLRSSMTIFDIVCPDDIYSRLLDVFFNGERCKLTLDILKQQAPVQEIEALSV